MLTTLNAIHALSNEQAGQQLPVDFEATVTYCRNFESTLFVQDSGAGIVVKSPRGSVLAPGDRVRVQGVTQASFRTLIVSSSITVLRHEELPKPTPATFKELIGGQRDALLVTVRGVVRSADIVSPPHSTVSIIYIEMRTGGGFVDAAIDTVDTSVAKDLSDAEVEVTGAAGGKFDDKMQQTGVLLHVCSPSALKIIKRSSTGPWLLPITPMDRILGGYRVEELTPRVRVRGAVTYYQPGDAVVLQDGNRSLWISTRSNATIRVGDLADATGFPDIRNGFLAITAGEIQDLHVYKEILPRQVTWTELAETYNKGHGHHFDLVAVKGQVVAEVRGAVQDEYVIDSDGHPFSAVYRHPLALPSGSLPEMKRVPIGSQVLVTGICMPNSSDPLNGPVAFDLYLRSFNDIAIVARPSPLSVRNLVRLASLLALIVLAVGTWAWELRRKVRQQTAKLAAQAAMEASRSRILVHINGGRALGEVLNEIAEMVSQELDGAPCHCEIAKGAPVCISTGRPADTEVLEEPIQGRSGGSLGTLRAYTKPDHKLIRKQREVLKDASHLAALAIETRRMYSDLVRRSEYDLLTEILNRFSLERCLDEFIARSREEAVVFGLIYIDLDDFKQVNDSYGHGVGDLYLQHVCQRMKTQLRSSDVLARLGGDEFAVVVPCVRSRADVEEIASRLKHCLDNPAHLGSGCVLQGSASLGIAMFPEDGETKDGLLNAADRAMYIAKQEAKQYRHKAKA